MCCNGILSIIENSTVTQLMCVVFGVERNNISSENALSLSVKKSLVNLNRLYEKFEIEEQKRSSQLARHTLDDLQKITYETLYNTMSSLEGVEWNTTNHNNMTPFASVHHNKHMYNSMNDRRREKKKDKRKQQSDGFVYR